MFSIKRQALHLLSKPLHLVDTAARGLCTSTSATLLSRKPNGTVTPNSRQNPIPSSTMTSLLKTNSFFDCNVQSVRSKVRVYYRPSAWKRYNKHNIEKRLTTPGGLEILWRRVLKGRHHLAVYERILPNTVDCKILAEHQKRYQKHPLTKQKLPKPGLF